MDTNRSQQKVQEFLKNSSKFKRKVRVTQKEFKADSSAIFKQLCPSRELDWIDGWDCELIYTKTGYAHKDCIFTTGDANGLGKGVWIFTNYEEYKNVELYIVNSSFVEQVDITLQQIDKNRTLGVWTSTYTALNIEGNKIVESMKEIDEDLVGALEGLEYFLENGKLLQQSR